MPCKLTDRSQVSDIVLDVIRDIEDEPNVQEATRFWADLRVDKEARRGYFSPIKTKVEEKGCALKTLKPGKFEDMKEVKEVVDAVWKDVKTA